MSKFFDQYSSILEKNLQRVRLKVDPLNKYAEDFAQYNGYEGYILAETEDAIKFFSNNEIVLIPKKAVVVEGILSGIGKVAAAPFKAAGRVASGIGSAATNLAAGAAGTPQGTPISRSVGSLGRQVVGGVWNTVTGRPSNPQPGAAADATAAAAAAQQNIALGKQVGLTKIPTEMAGKSFNIKGDRKGAAYIVARGKTYYVSQIKLTNGSGRLLEHKSFDDLFANQMMLLEAPQPPAPPVVPPVPPPNTPPNTQPTTPPNTPPNTHPANKPPAPQKAGVRFADITSKPEFVNEGALVTIVEKSTNTAYQGYGSLMRIPNTNDFAIAFASQQP
jgi:hypothetical protein